MASIAGCHSALTPDGQLTRIEDEDLRKYVINEGLQNLIDEVGARFVKRLRGIYGYRWGVMIKEVMIEVATRLHLYYYDLPEDALTENIHTRFYEEGRKVFRSKLKSEIRRRERESRYAIELDAKEELVTPAGSDHPRFILLHVLENFAPFVETLSPSIERDVAITIADALSSDGRTLAEMEIAERSGYAVEQVVQALYRLQRKAKQFFEL